MGVRTQCHAPYWAGQQLLFCQQAYSAWRAAHIAQAVLCGLCLDLGGSEPYIQYLGATSTRFSARRAPGITSIVTVVNSSRACYTDDSPGLGSHGMGWDRTGWDGMGCAIIWYIYIYRSGFPCWLDIFLLIVSDEFISGGVRNIWSSLPDI